MSRRPSTHLGPARTAQDVEKARAALEKSYHDRGYQTVAVSVPPQDPKGGIIVLKVTELKIGRLRVKNAHFFDIDKIKNRAASLREGTLPNFNAVTQDIVLNQWSDRRVTPALRAGVTPVMSTSLISTSTTSRSLHASVEINDRQSPGTTLLRLTGTAHYDDLWQIGHSLTFTYQVAPERILGRAGVFRILSRANSGTSTAWFSCSMESIRKATLPRSAV